MPICKHKIDNKSIMTHCLIPDHFLDRQKHNAEVFSKSMHADNANCNVDSHRQDSKKCEIDSELPSNATRPIPVPK